MIHTWWNVVANAWEKIEIEKIDFLQFTSFACDLIFSLVNSNSMNWKWQKWVKENKLSKCFNHFPLCQNKMVYRYVFCALIFFVMILNAKQYKATTNSIPWAVKFYNKLWVLTNIDNTVVDSHSLFDTFLIQRIKI